MDTFVALTKALADPGRIRILLALRRGELCVCQVAELFGFAPSTISKHLSILNHAGLIRSRKSERWVYYRLAGPEAPAEVRQAMDWVRRSVGDSPQGKADAKKLKVILKMDPVEICRRQKCLKSC